MCRTNFESEVKKQVVQDDTSEASASGEDFDHNHLRMAREGIEQILGHV